MITCITFDLDGTLVDTAREIAEAANRTLLEIGLPRRDTADVTQLPPEGQLRFGYTGTVEITQ